MNEGGYRDGRTGLLRHIEEAELALTERTARMTPALTKMLPSELRAHIDELRGVKAAGDESLSELTRVAEARVALVAALDEAIALGPSLTAELHEVPEGAP